MNEGIVKETRLGESQNSSRNGLLQAVLGPAAKPANPKNIIRRET